MGLPSSPCGVSTLACKPEVSGSIPSEGNYFSPFTGSSRLKQHSFWCFHNHTFIKACQTSSLTFPLN